MDLSKGRKKRVGEEKGRGGRRRPLPPRVFFSDNFLY
jgi:hypothetical protein